MVVSRLQLPRAEPRHPLIANSDSPATRLLTLREDLSTLRYTSFIPLYLTFRPPQFQTAFNSGTISKGHALVSRPHPDDLRDITRDADNTPALDNSMAESL